MNLPTDIAHIIYKKSIAARATYVENAVAIVLETIMKSIILGDVSLKKYDAAGVIIKVISFGNREGEYSNSSRGPLEDYVDKCDHGYYMHRSVILSMNDSIFAMSCDIHIGRDDDNFTRNKEE